MSSKRVLRWLGAVAALVLAAALLGVLFDSAGTKASSQPISPTAIEAELARVYHSELLGEGYDYEPSVSCGQSSPLAFTCLASIETPDAGLLQKTIQVACLAKATGIGQRCWTNTGEALQ